MAKAYVKRELATGKWYADVDGGDTPAGGGIDYSTEEQDTGLKWVDDKPVYQKTIALGALPEANQELGYDHGITDLETLIDMRISAISSTTKVMLPVTEPTGSQYTSFEHVDATKVYVKTGSALNLSSYTGYCTVKYTKTE